MFRPNVIVLFCYIVNVALVLCTLDDYRLQNKYLKDINYDLLLMPISDSNSRYSGNAKISFYPQDDIDQLQLNSKQLKINDVEISDHKNAKYYVTAYTNDKTEILTLTIKQQLPKGYKITVSIDYTFTLNDNMKGFYRIPYDYKGEKRWFLGTQFKPTYARMAFPCFDEPSYRAKFSIRIVRKRNQKIITDMQAISPTNPVGQDLRCDKLETSDEIPTYKVSFAIIYEESVTTLNRLTVRSAAHDGLDTNFAIKQFELIKNELKSYINQKAPIYLDDFVIKPDGTSLTDKSGTFTYKQNQFLYNDEEDEDKLKEHITKSLVHKTSHFWFGHSITFRQWWDDVWFQESFATFLEYFIANKIENDWKMDQLFVVELLQPSLYQDSIRHLRLSSPVSVPDTIVDLFDTHIINKGAAILRMLEHATTPATFQQSIQQRSTEDYNSRVKTTPEGFWDQLQRKMIANKQYPATLTIKGIMNLWKNNIGYPIMKISRHSGGNALIVEQTQYTSPQSSKYIPDQQWIVPISCTTKSSPNFETTAPTMWFIPRENYLIKDLIFTSADWVICNIQQTGYYRVNYEDSNWESLIIQLRKNHTKIHVLNRAQLIDDAFSLAKDGKLNFELALRLGRYLVAETDMIPWLTALRHFDDMLRRYENTDVFEYLKDYVLNLVSWQYRFLKFTELKHIDSHSVTTGRQKILATACYLGHNECVKNALMVYQQYSSDLKSVPANLRYPIYCTALRTSENKLKVWKQLWSLHETTTKTSLNEVILEALGCTDDQTLLKNYLDATITPSSPNTILYEYETEIIHDSVMSSHAGITVAIDMIEETLKKDYSRDIEDSIHKNLITLANNLKPRVQSNDHVIRLEQVIKTLKSLDERKYQQYIDILQITRHNGNQKAEYNDKNAAFIKLNVTNLTGFTPRDHSTKSAVDPTSTPQSSYGRRIIPTTLHFLSLLSIFVGYMAAF